MVVHVGCFRFARVHNTCAHNCRRMLNLGVFSRFYAFDCIYYSDYY